jgi:hypothetical protein
LRRDQDRGHLSDRTFRIVSRPQRGEQSADRGLREDTPMITPTAPPSSPRFARQQ